MKNQVHLITYVDRLTGGDMKALQNLLSEELIGIFAGVHLLPFFHPIDGSDAGFDPIDHTQIDSRLGSWEDIRSLSQTADIMADVIVNHVSAQSPQFLDYLEHGEKSRYSDLFLTLDKVFPKGASEKELLTVYRPRPGLPFSIISLNDGSKKLFWTTFTSNQIDIDVLSDEGKAYLNSILQQLHGAGIKMIRLDAAGYAIKKPGTTCFMIPESFDFINWFREKAAAYGIEILVEIHSYYKKQIEIARQVDWVYDFALPPLILHSFFSRTPKYLKKWFEISPRNAITVLDTHDGIGVIDVGRFEGQEGLLPEEDVELLVEHIHKNSKGQSRQATGAAASNLDLYQVNCTYFDALGRNEQHYILARAIQFFAPGVPQVYYNGLLAEPNDMKLLAQTKVGRDINRHYFTDGELANALRRPVVLKLLNLIKFRNSHPAFNGDFLLEQSSPEKLVIIWKNVEDWAKLEVDFNSLSFKISFSKDGQDQQLTL
jgi:sucrose phosphorylase